MSYSYAAMIIQMSHYAMNATRRFSRKSLTVAITEPLWLELAAIYDL